MHIPVIQFVPSAFEFLLSVLLPSSGQTLALSAVLYWSKVATVVFLHMTCHTLTVRPLCLFNPSGTGVCVPPVGLTVGEVF